MGYQVRISDWDGDIYIQMKDDSPLATFQRLAEEQSYLRAVARYHQERIVASRLGTNMARRMGEFTSRRWR